METTGDGTHVIEFTEAWEAPIMHIALGDRIPDFAAETTHGSISFHEWLGTDWGVLFSHPRDYIPFCTSDLGMIIRIESEFLARSTKVIGVSLDRCNLRNGGEDFLGSALGLPIVVDPDRRVFRLFGMIHHLLGGNDASVRSVLFVAPDKTLKLAHAYPRSEDRDFSEIFRAIDSIQLAEGSHNMSWSAGFSTSGARYRAVASASGSPSW